LARSSRCSRYAHITASAWSILRKRARTHKYTNPHSAQIAQHGECASGFVQTKSQSPRRWPSASGTQKSEPTLDTKLNHHQDTKQKSQHTPVARVGTHAESTIELPVVRALCRGGAPSWAPYVDLGARVGKTHSSRRLRRKVFSAASAW
jgi:hypothetical protein